MNIEFFPHFMRTNFPDVKISNEEAIAIGNDFKKYLLDKFEGKENKLKDIWNIDPIKIIINQGHPFKMKGYDPVFCFHFTEFVDKMKNEILS